MDRISDRIGRALLALRPWGKGLSQENAGHVLPCLGIDNHEIYAMSRPCPEIFDGSQVKLIIIEHGPPGVPMAMEFDDTGLGHEPRICPFWVPSYGAETGLNSK